MSKTYLVRLYKPRRGLSVEVAAANIVYVVEASDAVDAIVKVDDYTGSTDCESASAELFEGRIYPLKK